MPEVFISNQHFKCKQVLKTVPSPQGFSPESTEGITFFLSLELSASSS